MRGKVIEFNDTMGAGIISGDDGARYPFSRDAILKGSVWQAIDRGNVEFEVANGATTKVFILEEKSKLIAVLLAFFLGNLGLHKFYLEQKRQGLIYLGCTVIGFLGFFSGIGSGPERLSFLLVPALIVGIISKFDGIIYLVMGRNFYKKYGHEKE